MIKKRLKRLERNKIMRRISFGLLIILSAIFLPTLCYSDTELDGEWNIRERLCGYYSGQSLGCYRDSSSITISNDTVYSDGENVGSVTQRGNSVVFKYSESYLKTSLEEQLQNYGYDATIQSANISYRGTLKNDKIKGKINGKIVAIYQGYKIPIKYTGNFTAKKSSQSQSFYKKLDIAIPTSYGFVLRKGLGRHWKRSD